MDYALFFYNVILIVCFSINLTGYSVLYYRKNNLVYLWVAMMFALYTIDVTLIYMTEYFGELIIYYGSNLYFESISKVIITMFIIFTYRQISSTALQIAINKKEYIIWVVAFLISIIIFNINSGHNIILMWIYSIILEFLLLYNVIISILNLPKSTLSISERNMAKKLLTLTLLILSLGALEHFVVLATGSPILKVFPDFLQRRTMIEVLSVWVIIIGFYYLKRALFSYSEQKEQQSITENILQIQKVLHEKAIQYGKSCRLTPREIEILELLANHYTNQEISNELYISLGTVKVHVHSIFQKTGFSSRDQVEQSLLSLCNENNEQLLDENK